MIGADPELSGTIIDNFLTTLSSSCIYESSEGPSERHHIATVQPFAILCALHEMMPCKEILVVRFPLQITFCIHFLFIQICLPQTAIKTPIR